MEYSPNTIEIFEQYGLYLIKQEKYETAKKKLKIHAENTKSLSLLNIYFIALFNLAKQDSCKYNIERAIKIAERAKAINSELFPYDDKHEELKGLLTNND